MSSIYYIIKEENTKLSEKEAGNKEQIYRHYPEVLQIELTDRCNGECIMCSHFYKESLEPYLKYTKLVLLNGYGEPFVSSKYRRCMNLLKKYEAKAFVTTNLSVFNDDIADDAENIFSQISVSCHGVDKETYEKISRGLSFDRFVNNLEKLISLKNPPAIAISTVAMAANIKYAEDMVRFAHRHHIGEVRFGRLGINSYIGNSDQDLSNYPFVAAHYFRKALKAADSYGIRLIIPENYLSEKYDDSIMLKQQLEITGDQSFDIDVTAANDQQALTTIPAMTDVYEQALLLRPEIKNTELALKASEVQLKIAKAGHLPTVSLTGGLGTSTSSNNSKEWGQQVQTNFDASAGIGVSIPIFDQRKAKTAVNKANIQRELALLDQQDKQKKLYATIEGFWLDAQTNQQKFRAASATVESEQQSYDLLQEQFNLGLKNIVELMTGKTSLLKAQQNKLQSKYLTILNQQLLRFYQGETMTI